MKRPGVPVARFSLANCYPRHTCFPVVTRTVNGTVWTYSRILGWH